MSRLYSHRDRPMHLGPLPAERMPRDADARPLPATQPADRDPAGPDSVAAALAEYLGVAAALFDGPVAPATAPLPPADRWLAVDGVMGVERHRGGDRSIVLARQVRPIPEPARPLEP